MIVAAPPLLGAESAPLVIAHRGASGYLPEHTLAAKALGHAQGADVLEQDIVLTKDDVPVVLHDVELDTTTDVAARFPERRREDGRFYAVDFTLAEIRQLGVTERFNPKTGQPVYPRRFPLDGGRFPIATLEEELRFIQGLNRSAGRAVGICPEIKSPAWHRRQGRDISRVVLPILRRYGYDTKADACWIQCFDWDEVRRLRTELGWEGRVILLLGGREKGDGADPMRLATAEGLAGVAKIADGIGPSLGAVIAGTSPDNRHVTDLFRNAHAAGLVVLPYTVRVDSLPKSVESADELLKLLFVEAQVDGVFTDFPDVVVQWLTQRGTMSSPSRAAD